MAALVTAISIQLTPCWQQVEKPGMTTSRHCERNEAIQAAAPNRIASSLSLLAMTET